MTAHHHTNNTYQATPLENDYVALKPMQPEHISDLYQAGQDPNIWTWTTSNYCKSLADTEIWVNNCLEQQSKGQQLPYVIFDKLKGKIVGSTSYLHIDWAHKAIEIGYTFLSTEAQHTYVNRNCKLLLLTYAFETLEMNRVALQTHEKNQRSRKAILGIGAQFEGIQRWARIQADGSIRNSAFYSIIQPQWPQVKTKLIATLESQLRNHALVATK